MSAITNLITLSSGCTYFRNLGRSYGSLTNKTINNTGRSLLYKEYGEPANVLSLVDQPIQRPAASEVLVKWLLAPVNPADINTIQGKYPSKPKLPATPGNEGVGEILEVGPQVKTLLPGDRVVPNGTNLGTWTSHGIHTPDQLYKVPRSLGLLEACMLNVNPCTAYRLLKDFVRLKPGDSVIQNGGNSAVGQFIIQLAKVWELKSISVVRDRPNIQSLKDQLRQLGGTHVLTEQELRTTDIFKNGQVPRPLLGLNCIGGQNALDVLRQIGHGGVMVTYGGMSREPVTVPTSALIFKDISVKGFWMTAWTQRNHESTERFSMLDYLGKLFQSKELEVPTHKLVPLSDYQLAIKETLQLDGKMGAKCGFTIHRTLRASNIEGNSPHGWDTVFIRHDDAELFSYV